MTNLQKLEQAILANYKYEGMNIIEICKDKWVYLKDEKGNDRMEPIEKIIQDWDKHLITAKEIQDAYDGNSIIQKHFNKYGVLSQKQEGENYKSIFIIHDGNPRPGFIWNSSILTIEMMFYYRNNNKNIRTQGFVNSYILRFITKEDYLIKTSLENNVPKIISCNKPGPEENLLDNHESHLSQEKWEKEKEHIYIDFMDNINKFINEKPIMYTKNKNGYYMLQEGSNFIFKLQTTKTEYNNSGHYQIQITQMQILKNGQAYRDEDLSLSKMPSFKDTMSKEQLIKIIDNNYLDIENKAGANLKFRYK